MNTPTHFLLAAALLSKPQSPRRNLAVAAGALIPDASIFVFYGWEKLVMGTSEQAIWQERYWTEPWQTISAISNALALFVILFAAGWFLKSTLLKVFSLAAIAHIGLDFGFHAGDAHRHFWPLTDWRFHSPISYWDPAHHGGLGALLDFIILSASAIVLWRRFRALWVRCGLALIVGLFLATGLYFRLMLS